MNIHHLLTQKLTKWSKILLYTIVQMIRISKKSLSLTKATFFLIKINESSNIVKYY